MGSSKATSERLGRVHGFCMTARAARPNGHVVRFTHHQTYFWRNYFLRHAGSLLIRFCIAWPRYGYCLSCTIRTGTFCVILMVTRYTLL